MDKLKSVYFIVNANNKIGIGHLKRCLLLAYEFNLHNIPCSFISNDISDSALENIKINYQSLVFENLESLKKFILQKLPNNGNLIIFDSDEPDFYSLDFQQEIMNTGNKLMYITIKSNVKYLAHFLLNQNIMALSDTYITESYTTKLLGPTYFILSNDFKNITPNIFDPSTKKNLLISFGSSDPAENTVKILSILYSFQSNFKKIRVVVGGLNQSIETIQNHPFVKNNKAQVEIHYNIKNMYDLMKNTDLAFTSMGLTFWELTLHKVPCLVLSGSKREKSQIDYFCSNNYSHFIGNFDDVNWADEWKKNIQNYLVSSDELCINELYSKINVNGKTKVVEEIMQTYKAQSE
jgi:UDP-2,4-diacetamido-2,4,6-trideoxy-beta-L-altropyranose hydrolase